MASNQRLGKYFYIRVAPSGLVLEVAGAVDRPGACVVTGKAKTELEHNDHQLWYADQDSKTVRNKLNNFCIDAQDDLVVVNPYLRGNGVQLWTLADDHVHTVDDCKLVLTALHSDRPDTPVVAAPADGSLGQKLTFVYRPAQYFYIRLATDHSQVFDVRHADPKAGAKVLVYADKGDMADNQLWYEDQSGTVCSKLNGFVIDATGKHVVLTPPGPTLPQWVVRGDAVCSRSDPDLVLELREATLFTDATVTPAPRSAGPTQAWVRDYLPDQALSLNHSGNGKHFIIRSRANGLLLGVEDGEPDAGTPVAMGYRAPQHANDHQLFYEDDPTGTLRALLNDYCLEIEGDDVVMSPYDPYSPTQQWRAHGHKLQHRGRPECVLQLQEDRQAPGAHLTMADYTGAPRQHFDVTYVPARCFQLQSVLSDKVAGVRHDSADTGAEVLTVDRRDPPPPAQLWYEDERGMLRNKLNGYVLDATEERVRLRPYNPTSVVQQWIVVGDHVQNRADSKHVLDIEGESRRCGAHVIAYQLHGGDNQRWRLLYAKTK